ncbi:unannotated protein [freshwater metagenome]|uniref:Unannotated protein n=1 Tax=freshwater metagenome TaxID=449393 RepID=A0A6J7LLJ9_9ZZZZ
MAEQLGHEIDGDVQKRVGRTSSQDSGVAVDADVVVATASLEVGFDDDRVGAVLQHKAPHDVAQFLQRKGRAGRNPATRPWTVVVLSDWGRDREAWDAYDALFSPVVPPRSLPLDNLYVLRIQAVYSLLDWLARELDYGKSSTWADASGPADLLASEERWRQITADRQARLATLLTSLLREGPERSSFVRHLRRSLALGTGPAADATVDKVLWEAPRPLIGAVVPTLRRRLVDQWQGERPASDDAGVRTRTPLRDFVPGNLFDELLVPDVEFQVPWARGDVHVEHLPALRAIREFLPGNVSRHFGVWASSKRHWVSLSARMDSEGRHAIDVARFGGMAVDEITTADGVVRIYAPTRVTLEPVPEEISDASSMRADWIFHATPLGAGTKLALSGALKGMFGEVAAHLHSQGGGVRVLRYAEFGQGVLWESGKSTPVGIRFESQVSEMWERAALGVEIHVDALVGRVVAPDFEPELDAVERTEWLRDLVRDDASLPPEVSTFERAALADCAEAFAAVWDWSAGSPSGTVFLDEIKRVATVLGLHDPRNPGTLSTWLDDVSVGDAVLLHVVAARSAIRSETWESWLTRRFTLSAAHALVHAIASGNSHVDPEDLLVDLDPDDPLKFFISEQSPGGSGQVEALTLSVIEEPERLPMALADVLRPTDLERLDEQVRMVVDCSDPGVLQAVSHLADAWSGGHDDVRCATEALDVALEATGIVLEHPAKVALTTRLAGPGASPDFLAEVREWLVRRDHAQESSGLEVGPRTLAALLAERSEADVMLHLDTPDEPKRARAIANVLWPWGRLARSNGSFNPFSDGSSGSFALLRQHWQAPVPSLEFSTWNDEQRDAVHVLLRDKGEVMLRTRSADRRELRAAVLDLHTAPIEVGPLWCFPEVLGIHDRGSFVEVRMILRESW